ncbi:lipase family protein [Gallaecimonas kandeliae]|uniref:lipase family protein n=1 Tax=Gallaecimonas kandeliae TaxID=3029055 RepID=UPI0026491A3C|nr:lipase family protein [Gallaecimonas kandeliae]WKE67288.1 lipase family protein [Gallaecimonas kandeliae]
MSFYNHPQHLSRANLAHLSTLSLELGEGMFKQEALAVGEVRLGLEITNKHLIVVVHHPETNTRDWATDLKALPVPWPEARPLGKVHQGFLALAHQCLPQLVPVLAKHLKAGVALWLTGHGVGGAIASVLAAELALVEELEVTGLCTFGSPRVFDNRLAAALEEVLGELYWRVVNDQDVVTRLPPRCFGYRHGGHLSYFDATGRLHLADGQRWWDGFWDRCQYHGQWLFAKDISDINEHSVEEYQFLTLGARH